MMRNTAGGKSENGVMFEDITNKRSNKATFTQNAVTLQLSVHASSEH